MKSPFLVIHDAVLDRLKGQTSLTVYDDVPDNALFPYVAMGPIIGRDWSDKFEDGQEIFLTLDFWSQYMGRKEVAEMMDDALQALTSSPLDLGASFKAALDALDMNEIIIDIDGKTRHGILKMKYLVEQL